MTALANYDFDRQGNLVPLRTRLQVAQQQTAAPSQRRKFKPEPQELRLDPSRDDKLTAFGKATLGDRYLLPGESIQQMFARVSCAFADDASHAQRLYDAMSKLWFMPATPILSNGGTTRGLPISCFLNTVPDSLDGIVSTWNENVHLASNGGGIGTYWGGVRSIGETVRGNGETSGIIPFIRVMDSLTLAISQGSLRRGSAAVYLDVHHPEIEEFLEIRKASGDFNRKSLNLHHAVNITDDFMEAVRADRPFGLKSPKTGETLREISARQLWQKILEIRLQTGEPYLLFSDTVNRALPKHQRDLGLKVSSSNLCAEITLPTGRDHLGNERTAVCCLSSLNIETWDEWHEAPGFIEDVLRFLDNVLTHFIEEAPDGMEKAAYAAMRERSVGLGVMGFHSFLQARNIPFESAMAKAWNLKIFRKIRRDADSASVDLAEERGACPDAAERGMQARFSHKLAIAPTASISIICGGASACIEPIPANVYTHKTLSGSFSVRNPSLARLLAEKGADTAETWQSIIEHEGSVQHLDILSDDEKSVFRTAFEIDQRWIIDFAADRAPFICQSQSINLYLPSDVDKWDLHMLHWSAWEKGLKSLYYCRSKSVQRAAFVGKDRKAKAAEASGQRTDYDECLACQ
ncbi:MAG TPA: ribonucleoside-diphosphate reductase subunit alpha [Candidatus Sulfotelmatobacter sp.]|jgi:ribonucleoside-diphosphate reductase alpha chain|nr:ribonucleoside-diphosphate reductase subunit alpha [Candidatus Sulfotelmatobacter sp.]